jgi:hypothetical protein
MFDFLFNRVAAPFDVRRFLDDQCEFGFALNEDGKWQPVVKCCGEKYTVCRHLLKVIESRY